MVSLTPILTILSLLTVVDVFVWMSWYMLMTPSSLTMILMLLLLSNNILVIVFALKSWGLWNNFWALRLLVVLTFSFFLNENTLLTLFLRQVCWELNQLTLPLSLITTWLVLMGHYILIPLNIDNWWVDRLIYLAFHASLFGLCCSCSDLIYASALPTTLRCSSTGGPLFEGVLWPRHCCLLP